MKDINLDGAEVSVIKALGVSGAAISGEILMDRCSQINQNELLSTLQGLLATGYVSSETDVSSVEDIKKSKFQVNTGYSRAIKEALDPQPSKQQKSRRVRRE